MQTESFDAIVVGAGILGLAHAYHLAKVGQKVLVIERGQRALGASVRNFGMIWPVGQPPGEMREIAVRSREIWLEVLEASGIWHERSGSLHLAYHDDEMAVLEEFIAQEPGYGAQMIGADLALEKSPVVRREGLKGAMWSDQELCVNPRTVISQLPDYLKTVGVEFRFGTAVTQVESGRLLAGGQEIQSERIFLCTGDDFETLFPERFAASGLDRCKLQMMKARPLQSDYRIRTHLCAGLTLGHYSNFSNCKNLDLLLARFRRDWPEQMEWGIHLLISQHEIGDLTIGDSHEYGLSPDPFLREFIDALILDYLNTFMVLEDFEITERWHGVYAKHPTKKYIIDEPLDGVTVVTGVGGAGMTLSFGMAHKVLSEKGI